MSKNLTLVLGGVLGGVVIAGGAFFFLGGSNHASQPAAQTQQQAPAPKANIQADNKQAPSQDAQPQQAQPQQTKQAQTQAAPAQAGGISQADAEKIVKDKFPGAKVTYVEREMDDGVEAYEVHFFYQNNPDCECKVATSDGRIIKYDLD